MPVTKQATVNDVESFARAEMLSILKEEAVKLAESGDLQITQSIFSDAGDDYNRLHTKDGKPVGYWAGY